MYSEYSRIKMFSKIIHSQVSFDFYEIMIAKVAHDDSNNSRTQGQT